MKKSHLILVLFVAGLLLLSSGSSLGEGDPALPEQTPLLPVLEARAFSPPNSLEVLRSELWEDFLSLPPEERPTMAVVLGGGGARGLAHVGVLQVLSQKGVPIEIICGTSVGSYVGALYASGASPQVLRSIGENVSWNQLVDFTLSSRGLFNTRPLERLVNLQIARLLTEERQLSESRQYLAETNIEAARIEDLPIRYACVATNLQTGEAVVFDRGPIAPAVRASCSIPGIFEAYEYQGQYLVDGGVVNNLPVDVARAMGADFIIAVDVDADLSDYTPSGVISIIHQVIRIQGQLIVENQRRNADFVIKPMVDDIGVSELERGKDARREGIFAAEKMMRDLQDKLIAESMGAILRRRGILP